MRNNTPLISIIMNCYNGEKYLKKSIKSVFSQTYKNWELIFWDNKSNDNSFKIIDRFKNKKIRYFRSKKYTKLYEARNLALSKTKGELICFLDTDDYWKKNFLFEHLKSINNSNHDLVFSSYLVKNQITNKVYVNKNIYNNEKGLNLTQRLLNNYTIGISAVLFKKKLLKKIKFNKKYEVIGDFDFFIKLSLKNKFYFLNKNLMIYRFHSSNFTTKNLKIYFLELSYWLKKNKKKLLKFNLLSLKFFVVKIYLKYLIQVIKQGM